MVNIIEDIYEVAYTAGAAKKPVFIIFAMPNKQGKSITAFRYLDHRNTLILAGDSTTNTTRKKLFTLFKQGKLAELNLLIVEDWTKIREKVKEGMAAILTMFANTIISIDQEKLEIPPSKVHASIIINVPLSSYKEVIKHLLEVGAGDRFIVIKASLSDEKKEELWKLGFLNGSKELIPITIKQIELSSFSEFADKYLESHESLELLNLAYAADNIKKGLFEEIQNLSRNPISDISWENVWQDE